MIKYSEKIILIKKIVLTYCFKSDSCIVILTLIMLYSQNSFSTNRELEQEPNTFINIEFGKIAFFDNELKNNSYGLEYIKKHNNKWQLDSLVGIVVSQEYNKYVYYGLNRDWRIKESIILSSSLSMGLFDNNKKIDLGHTIEFRTKFTIAYLFKNNHRLGLSISHLSNSKLSNKNPGTESLNLSYTIPIKNK